MKNQNSKLYLAFKIITTIAFIIVLAFSILYFIDFEDGGMNYFKKHFVISIILFLVGIIAILLPKLNQKTLQGENKGDRMMLGVGLLLFVCSILSCLFSYFSW
ncbi:MAG: hypothetical protein K2O05_03805 [Anaeroplasmataceae bacterium]|nr:hypothetical protein [Anaeroplasmataceae bacterium]